MGLRSRLAERSNNHSPKWPERKRAPWTPDTRSTSTQKGQETCRLNDWRPSADIGDRRIKKMRKTKQQQQTNIQIIILYLFLSQVNTKVRPYYIQYPSHARSRQVTSGGPSGWEGSVTHNGSLSFYDYFVTGESSNSDQILFNYQVISFISEDLFVL